MAFSITSASTRPKINARMCCRRTSAAPISSRDRAHMAYRSCLEAALALSVSCRPRYWETTTAPPVERAEKT